MSTQTEAAADWRVKFSRNLHPDGREQIEVEMFDEEQYFDFGLQQTENPRQINLQAKRVFKFSLGLFYFLILAGLMTRYLLASLENNRINQQQTEMSVINNHLLDEINQLKKKTEGNWCPEEWMEFGNSCYFKSTVQKSWTDSRRFCQDRGADLLVLNSKEEKEFVSTLNQNAESWIGLFAEESQQKHEYEWKWVDGSPLTITFWNERYSKKPYYNYNAGSLSADGKWTQRDKKYNINWICEK
ncbi:CD209 antigen-like protein E [Oryzias latipes]|uniref:CD209 antigen-like protein E n=1 Tax=Oryzias latipes TaxID=8090 RepID=UPI000CE1EC3B|nr:CD209 antigen-like protein E [Oryzias latipes]